MWTCALCSVVLINLVFFVLDEAGGVEGEKAEVHAAEQTWMTDPFYSILPTVYCNNHNLLWEMEVAVKWFLFSEDHPEVEAMVLSALEEAKQHSTCHLSLYTEALENHIKQVHYMKRYTTERLYKCSTNIPVAVTDWRGRHWSASPAWLGARQLSCQLLANGRVKPSRYLTRHPLLSQRH